MNDPVLITAINLLVFGVGMYFGVNWIARLNKRGSN